MAEKFKFFCLIRIVRKRFFHQATFTYLLYKNPDAFKYRMRAIIGRSRFEAALVYKPRILGLKNEEFPFLVHKLSVI